MKKIALIIAVVAIVVMDISSTAFAVEEKKAEVSLGVEYFSWKEFAPRVRTQYGEGPKERFVSEQGLMESIGISYKFSAGSFWIKPKIEMLTGQTYYQGCKSFNVFHGNEKYDSASVYFGQVLELASGWNFHPSENVGISPFVTAGYSTWVRTIGGELWETFYAKPGVKIDYGKFFIEGGAIIPTRTVVYMYWPKDWSPNGERTFAKNVTGNVNTWFAGIGWKGEGFSVKVSYEIRKFAASNMVKTAPNSVFYSETFQPDSISQKIGVWCIIPF